MVIAGEGTPTQAVLLGLVWVVWFGVMAIWPRWTLIQFRRFDRWKGEGFGPWAGWPPERPAEPWEPSNRIVTLYRWVAVALAAAGVVLTAGGLARM